jgi:hypothetical protein
VWNLFNNQVPVAGLFKNDYKLPVFKQLIMQIFYGVFFLLEYEDLKHLKISAITLKIYI